MYNPTKARILTAVICAIFPFRRRVVSKFAQIVINEGDVMNIRNIFVFAMRKGGDENINIKAQGFFLLYRKMFVMYYNLRKNNKLFMYFTFSL